MPATAISEEPKPSTQSVPSGLATRDGVPFRRVTQPFSAAKRDATPGLSDILAAPESGFDSWDPANVSPLVAYLSTPECRFSGETFYIKGGVIKRVQSWEMAERIEKSGKWTVEELDEALGSMSAPPVDADMN